MSIELSTTYPITDALPAGEDIRNSPEMDILSAEMEKFNNPSPSSSVDWDKVEQVAVTILEEKSKDLLVASYLAVALIQKNGIAGLDSGLYLLKTISEKFWDNLYPSLTRLRGRKQAIQWWSEKAVTYLRNNTISESPIDIVVSLTTNLDLFDSFLAAAMEESPSLFELKNMISMLSVHQEQDTASTLTPIATAAGSLQKAAILAEYTSPQAVIDEDSARRTLANALQTIGQVADFLFEANPYDSEAFRLSRLAAWTRLNDLPLSTDGKTLLEAPPKQLLQSLQSLHENAKWEALLKASEDQVSTYLFWLELTFHAATALDQLNQQRSLAVLEQLTAAYVNRLKGIEKLSFSDGTPFASLETKGWIKKITKKYGSGGDGANNISQSHNDDALRGAISEDMLKAMDLKKSATLQEALIHLEIKLESSSSARESLFRRKALVTFLVESNKAKQAIPLMERLISELDLYRLDRWDPDLAMEILSEIYLAYRAQEDSNYEDKAEKVMSRISGISPAMAISIEL